MYVKQWMGTEVVTVAPDETVAVAEKLLKDHKIRRLPVVEAGVLVGIISPHDLKKVMPSILDAEGASEEIFIADHTEIRTVMTSSPITVGPDDTLVEAIRREACTGRIGDDARRTSVKLSAFGGAQFGR